MPTLVIDGDASGAIKAHADLEAAAKRSGRAHDDVTRSAEQLERQLKRVIQENETPQERYNRKIQDLAKYWDSNNWSVEQHLRAMARYRAELDEATSKQDKAADSRYHAVLNDQLNKLPRIVSETQRLNEGYTTTGASLDKVAEKTDGAFGSHAIGHIVKFAAEVFAIEKSLEMVTEALREAAEERRQLAEDTRGALGSYGELGAIGGKQKDIDFARQLQAEGIVQSESEAATTTEGVVTAHVSDQEREYLFKLAKDKTIRGANVGEFALGVKGFQERYGAQAGSFENVAKEMLEAARVSGQSPAEIARAVSRLAPTAQEEGIDPVNTIAMYATLARSATGRKQAVSESEKIIKGESDFSSPELKALYDATARRISGAPTAADAEPLIHQDPRLAAQLGAEEREASRKAYIKSISEEREGLAEEVLAFEKQREVKRQGEWLGGLDSWLREKAQRGTLFGFIPGRAALGLEDEYLNNALKSGELPEELAGRVRNYREGRSPKSEFEIMADQMERHHAELKKQTEIMERSDRTPPPPNGRQE